MSSKQAKQRRAAKQRQIQHQNRRRANAAGPARPSEPSRPTAPGPWRWREPQAGDLANLRRHDPWAKQRATFAAIAEHAQEWAGIPQHVGPEIPLVIEPSYPFAHVFDAEKAEPEADNDGAKIRNVFWSWSRRSDVYMIERNGRVTWGIKPGVHHASMLLNTIGASFAWGIEQESRALQLLATLLRHHQFKQYLLTGSFLETSPRSGVTYMFRKLRPTLAITLKSDEPKILCALCQHPIGYYGGSWGGAMCPTDDVVAHLMLMRGDEHMFWRRSNQHPAWRREAGI